MHNNPLAFIDPSGFQTTGNSIDCVYLPENFSVLNYGGVRSADNTQIVRDGAVPSSPCMWIPAVERGSSSVGWSSAVSGPQSPQCTPPAIDRSKEASVGDLPHFQVSTFIGYGLSKQQLNTVFDRWRNGSSWAPGGSPNTKDGVAYLLDGVGGDYYNWVYITTDADSRTFTGHCQGMSLPERLQTAFKQSLGLVSWSRPEREAPKISS